jgi:3-phenylpropionate/cinnamic acid dioxygenase small subunit
MATELAAIDDTEVSRFLYREARLMDEHRYRDWLGLFADDAIYWVPCGGPGDDAATEVAFIYDNRARLEDRIARFESGTVLAQEPKAPMRRVISNVEATPRGRDIEVLSNFILVEARRGTQFLWAGQSTHRLRRVGAELRIAFKKVVLVNNDQEIPSLQFLV